MVKFINSNLQIIEQLIEKQKANLSISKKSKKWKLLERIKIHYRKVDNI
jgi:hypothetical protein